MDSLWRRSGAGPALGLALAGTAILAGNLAFLSSLPRPRGATVLVSTGWLLVAQGTSAALAILAAVWIVWGAGRLTTRLAVSACWLTILILLWQALYPAPRWPWIKYEQQLLTFCTWLGAIGLCAAAWRFGIRVVDQADRALGSDPRSRQMSLLGLMALMSGTAIILGVLRLIMPRSAAEWTLSGDDVFRLIVQVGGSLLVASTIITCFHQPRALWLNLILVVAFVLAIAALHLLAYGQSYRMYIFPPEPRLLIRMLHYVVLTLWLLAAVSLLGRYGLKLRQVLSGRLLRSRGDVDAAQVGMQAK